MLLLVLLPCAIHDHLAYGRLGGFLLLSEH